MFTTIEKYQKAFLVFITVLLTAAFGLGGVCFTIFDPSNFTSIASIGELNKSYSQSQFAVAVQHWRGIHRLSRKMSPQAKAAGAQIDRQDYQQYIRFMQGMILDQMEAPPIWNQVYMLSNAVQKVDAEIDKQIESTPNPLTAQEILQRRIDAYLNMSEDNKKRAQEPLTEKDVWKCLILAEEAASHGIQVSNVEVDTVVRNTIDRLGGRQAFNRELSESMRMLYSDFRSIIGQAIAIAKLIDTKASTIKVRSKEVFENVKSDYQEFQVDYVVVNSDSFVAKNEADSRKQRIAFFEKNDDLAFFVRPPSASFEFVYANEEAFLPQNTPSEEEIKNYADKNMDRYRDHEEDLLEEVLELKRGRIIEDLNASIAKQKAQSALSSLRITLGNLTGKVPLDNIAKSYNLSYGQHSDVAETNFLDLKDVGTTSAKKQIYESLKSGDFSRVFAGRTQGYFFVRLTELVENGRLSKEDVANDENAFLKAYYENNKWDFKSVDEYRLAYVVADYNEIEKSLIPTTNDLKQFYDKYKEELYKTEDGYQDFNSVKNDVLSRAKNLLKTRILQKIGAVQKQCKNLGNNANVGPAVEELGRRVGLKYYESASLQTVDEIKKENVPGDDEFSPNVTKDTKVSEVVDYKNGKYFFIVLEHKSKDGEKFEEVREEVKEKFLQKQAVDAAKNFANDVAAEFTSTLAKAKKSIDTYFEGKDAKEIESEKIAKLEKISQEVFRTVALKHSLTYHRSAPFVNIADVSGLKDFKTIDSEIKKASIGSVGVPVEDSEGKSVCLFLLNSKREPTLNEIPQTKLVNIQQGLWELRYREKLRDEFVNYDRLVEKFSFSLDDSAEELDEEDLLDDEDEEEDEE
ncbi:hypothetical protein [Candidatus Uabimicrobium amorphum]|uniref:PpiC domain-containing protein n=1 Tax=Uabimicrobium amorphum TaxID=2596890 RepID=A0A5S9IX58_UABAM|nr:hypothetical protein [Candidatus Uabimicrobium amorphum]BBM88155.1 hypothetical protein UABAM_06571 [Candidatus Uabimicrobium amorphum]